MNREHLFVGFAGFLHVPGISAVSAIDDKFKPVSTVFQVLTSVPNGAGQFEYSYEVPECQDICPSFDPLLQDENYVGVSVAATRLRQARSRLNIASLLTP